MYQHLTIDSRVTVLVALCSLLLAPSAFATTVKQGQGGCAKLTTSFQEYGFVTYLQSYVSFRQRCLISPGPAV